MIENHLTNERKVNERANIGDYLLASLILSGSWAHRLKASLY